VAAAAFLPFLRGVAAGHAFYFRDLSRYFFPLRRFAAEGLRAGELRFWNPYVHEGEPVPLPPISYPLDLLQALLPHEQGFTLLLALHVPLAALTLMLLARKGLRLSLPAAAAGGIVYALGGFTLSCVNLYVYVQVVAWAPLLILGMMRAGEGDPRGMAVAAATTAVCLSTTGLEMAAQTALAALLLAWPARRPRRILRLLVPLALGAGLAAPTLVTVGGLVEGSARGGGFPTEITLAHAIHPLTLVQTVVAHFYGDPANLTGRWWGQNFFPRGFPYFLSLYVGLSTLCLAAAGLVRREGPRWRLALLASLGLVACLGAWAGLTPVVEALPLIRRLRFPSKAFFSVHLAVALLAALGVDAVQAEARRALRTVAALATTAGLLLVAGTAWPALAPASAAWFRDGFFPPHLDASTRIRHLDHILQDAALGGAVALAVGLLALLQLRGRLRPGLVAAALAFLLAADLLRAGSGLNPMVTPAFYAASPESGTLASLFQAEGRVFTCDPEWSDAYWAAHETRGEDAEAWAFAVLRATFTPYYNVSARVRTALSADLTMLAPTHRVISGGARVCSPPDGIVPRLREAGVANVVSVEPLGHPSLRLRGLLRPRDMAPLPLFVYAFDGALPWWSLAGHVEAATSREDAERRAGVDGLRDAGRAVVEGAAGVVEGAHGQVEGSQTRPGALDLRVEADQATVLVVREAYARGWQATVNGRPAPVLRADGRHQAIPVPAGTSTVRLRYRPPHVRWAAALSVVSALALMAAWRRPRRGGVASRAMS
jgi:hypothetical protein